MQLPLTDRQRKILVWIADHIDQHGYQPSIRDIGVKFKIKSPHGVASHLAALEKKGYVNLNAKTARAIKFDWREWAGRKA
jgi:repressor LexA